MQLTTVLLQAGGEDVAIDPTIVIAGFIVLLVISIGVGYWVYKDASNRDNNELLWGIGVGALLFLFPILGIIALVAYVILRNDETTASTGEDAASGEW